MVQQFMDGSNLVITWQKNTRKVPAESQLLLRIISYCCCWELTKGGGDLCWRHCLHFYLFTYGFVYRRKNVRYELIPGNWKPDETKYTLGVIFKDKLSFKNCKSSGWQKRKWARTFFVKLWVFKPVSHETYSIHQAHICWLIYL